MTSSGAPPPGPPPPGWYPDPGGTPTVRWWNGGHWSEVTQPVSMVATLGGTRVSTVADPFELSGWWYRVGGYVLDDLIVGVPFFIIGVVVGLLYGVHHIVFATSPNVNNGQDHSTLLPTAVAVVLVALTQAATLLYAYLFLRFKGQTVGMMAAGIKAVDKATGASLGSRQVLVRVASFFALNGLWELAAGVIGAGHPAPSAAASVALAFRAVAGIGFLVTMFWPLGSDFNQTLQDKAAGTVVVRTRF